VVKIILNFRKFFKTIVFCEIPISSPDGSGKPVSQKQLFFCWLLGVTKGNNKKDLQKCCFWCGLATYSRKLLQKKTQFEISNRVSLV
jgi:hypothetical protein